MMWMTREKDQVSSFVCFWRELCFNKEHIGAHLEQKCTETKLFFSQIH
jgi:hypothetical protein